MKNPAPQDPFFNLPWAQAPDSIWTSIETGWDSGLEPKQRRRPALWSGALAAAAVLGAATLVWRTAKTPDSAWDVVRLDGSPFIASKPMAGVAKIGVGQWLQTDASSRARIRVGNIGTV